MINIGDEVKYYEEWYEVLDVAYMDDKMSFVSASSGNLYVLLETDVMREWIRSDKVETYSGEQQSSNEAVLGLQMTQWLRGLEHRPDSDKLFPIVTMLLAIQYDKEGYYGSSWKGKGEYRGIVANLDRKYDRLDKITNDEITGKRKPLPTASYDELTGSDVQDIGESKIDAIADLTVYGLLYMTYLRDTYPGAFRVWVAKNIPAYLRDKIPFISE